MDGWISGIIISVISGFIVYFATSFISKRKDNKVYIEKLKNANYELLHSIKPLVLEKEGLNIHFIDAVSSSIAKKYEVIKTDLIKASDIIDKIVTEISQSFFLSNEQKKAHINSLLKIKESIIKDKKNKELQEGIKNNRADRRQTSFMLASITFAYILFGTSMSEIINRANTQYSQDKLIILTLISVIIPIFIFGIFQIFRELQEHKKYLKTRKLAEQELKRYFKI